MDPASYLVIDSANSRSFQVDTQRREYVVQTPGRPLEPSHSGNTFIVEIETRDTGEQRQAFGHTARHFVTTEHRRMEHSGQPPSDIQELVTDGWYLDVPGRFPGLTTGHRPPGIAICEKTADHLLEVTELSEDPLDPKLFEPPPGFRRVIRPFPGQRLSWADRAQFYWQQFLDWLGIA